MGCQPTWGICVFGMLTAWSALGRTEPNACATAYEKGQESRSDGRLREAREEFQFCLQSNCSEFVRTDCGRWLGEVESSLPSLVLVATSAGREIEDAQVTLDGQPLVERLDGKAVIVDPGHHRLKFSYGHAEPVELELVIREGEKARQVKVDFPSARSTEAPSSRPHATEMTSVSKDRGWLPYALGGVGVLGLAGFALFGLEGKSEKSDRERTCAPECSDADVRSIRDKFHVADVSLGVGVLALGAASYFYFTAPTKVEG